MKAADDLTVEMVSAWLKEASDLRDREKEALYVFAHTINPEAEDKGWASLDYLAEVSGINRKTLSRGLLDLVNRGILVNVGRHQGKSRGSMERRITDLAWADVERVWESRRDSAGTADSLASRLGSRGSDPFRRDTLTSDSRRDTSEVRRDTSEDHSRRDTVGTPTEPATESQKQAEEEVRRDSKCPLNRSSSSNKTTNSATVTGTPTQEDTSLSSFERLREEMRIKAEKASLSERKEDPQPSEPKPSGLERMERKLIENAPAPPMSQPDSSQPENPEESELSVFDRMRQKMAEEGRPVR